MILQQLGWSYGHLRQMQSMQKAAQLTTFCVKSKEKYKCSFFKKCNSICDKSCIYGIDIKIDIVGIISAKKLNLL